MFPGIKIGTAAVLLFITAGTAIAAPVTQKCGGAGIATGPFSYDPTNAGAATYIGTAGNAQSTKFRVQAPNESGDTVVFPGQGQNACLGQADAVIGVLEITKVGDADGNLVAEPIAGDSALFGLIKSAFTLNPSAFTFQPGSSVEVDVGIANPKVSSADYGEYSIKLAAKADGAGIGVGEGSTYSLTLKAATQTDTTPPRVNVVKPAGDQILGVIGVQITAEDPVPGSGVASLSASVSSAGGTVANVPVSLSLNQVLPVAAGAAVTGTGSFVPVGGTGSAGTSDVEAFTAASPSGIGSYVVNARARDVAGNVGQGSGAFTVSYSVSFTRQMAASNCMTRTGTSGAQCTGMFSFVANRSNVTSDGAAMFDHTVVVDLVKLSDGAIVASHAFGTGSVLANVQLDAVTATYQTHFKRADLGVTVP
ncbi:MAG TPA: hypothetical protein VJM11_00890, partial [Nevskiaceae bacterium]|nr:hypothetical protein [Nevskiaceae bacterium]